MRNTEQQHILFDGTSLKTISNLPALADMQQRTASAGVTSLGEAYGAVAYGYRCTHLRANAISQMPYTIRPIGKKPREAWAYQHKLPRLLWQTEAALCLYGAAYWFRKRNLLRTLDYQWLAPQTIRPTYDHEDGLIGFRRDLGSQQRRAFNEALSRDEQMDSGVPILGSKPDYDLDDVVYFFLPDPEVEIGPGRPPTLIAFEPIGLLKYVNVYASGFFQRGAIPAVLLSVKGSAQESELKRLEHWWKRLTAGVSKAWQTIAVRADVTPQIIGQSVKDLGMVQLSNSVRGQIAVAYGVPQTLLEDAANYATAKTHRKSFYVETIIPEALLIQGMLNEQVFQPAGYQFEFLPEKLQIMQEEEAERSFALATLVNAGVPLLVSLNILGFYIEESVLDDLELSLQSGGDPQEIDRQKLLVAQARVRIAAQRADILQARDAPAVAAA